MYKGSFAVKFFIMFLLGCAPYNTYVIDFTNYPEAWKNMPCSRRYLDLLSQKSKVDKKFFNQWFNGLYKCLNIEQGFESPIFLTSSLFLIYKKARNNKELLRFFKEYDENKKLTDLWFAQPKMY